MIQVIPRLPFQNPQEPLTKKAKPELRQEGKILYDYQLPMAIIRLKQALGRTVRRPQPRFGCCNLRQSCCQQALRQTNRPDLVKRKGCSGSF